MKTNKWVIFLTLCIQMVMLTSGIASSQALTEQQKIDLIRTPNEGIQPQAAVDDTGVIHLIYFKGNPSAGDIFYVSKEPGDKGFSKPIRVNSQSGSAIAMGNIRGAHIAVGRNRRVHVSWMGSKNAEPKVPQDETPMLFSRLNDQKTAFEPQRNIIQFATGLDGGGSVAADQKGNVYVAWHAGEHGKGDRARRLWVARSSDEGRTFTREVPASDESKGACGCCGMRAYAAHDGTLYLLYRAATDSVDRDMYLVTSGDQGKTFQSSRLHEWKIEACPMSTASISEGADGVRLAWETNGQVYYSKVSHNTLKNSSPIQAPGESNRRKHQATVSNAQGETLFVWTEKMGWKQGGTLAWQVFDRAGKPTTTKGQAEGVPVWSLITAYASPGGSFTIIY